MSLGQKQHAEPDHDERATHCAIISSPPSMINSDRVVISNRVGHARAERALDFAASDTE
jgi:hypothetical protein